MSGFVDQSALTPPTHAEIRAEEARMLQDRAKGSARSVFILVAVIAISLISVDLHMEALIWAVLASLMVGVTLFYAGNAQLEAAPPARIDRYLNGHIAISACTGALWAFGSLQLASPTSELQTFMAGLFVTSISAGGVMAGTIYRPGYLALATCSLLPFGGWLFVTMDGVQQIYGGFILFFLTFCYSTNKAASQKTRDAIVAKLTSRKAEEALERFAENAKAHRETTRSLQAVRHDMAQPLLALRNFVSELDRQVATPELAVLARQIRLAVLSQETLVQELTNVETPFAAPIFTSLDVPALLQQLDAEYRPQLSAKFCDLHIECSLQNITTDGARLERILRNFLSNAVKYGSAGGSVKLSVQVLEDTVQLRVKDQGQGIPAEQLAALQAGAPQPASATGSGLGLGIARQLAETIGGRIDIASVDGKGAAFTLTLPYQQDADSGGKRAFVLCIGEAELPKLGAWADLISGWVWQYAHAHSCAEALELVKILRLAPDLIVLNPNQDAPLTAECYEKLAEVAPLVQVDRQADGPSPSQGVHVLPLPRTEVELQQALLERL